jgi:hypothetical protein
MPNRRPACNRPVDLGHQERGPHLARVRDVDGKVCRWEQSEGELKPLFTELWLCSAHNRLVVDSELANEDF